MVEVTHPAGIEEPVEIHGRRWLLITALGIIVLSLVLLFVIPLLVQQRARRIWTEVLLLQDADQQTSVMTYLLARQMSLLRGYLVEGDTLLLRQYLEHRAAQDTALDRLEQLRPHLSPETAARFDRGRTLIDRWHVGVDDALGRQLPSAPANLGSTALARPVYVEAIDAVDWIRTGIGDDSQVQLAHLSSLERWATMLESGLMVLALLSTGLVVWLGGRLRLALRTARALQAKAARLSAGKERLLRGITHDLKNPLGAARMYAQLLAAGTYGEVGREQRQPLDRINSLMDHVLGLVNDLLELALMESGRLVVARTPFSLGTLLSDLRSDYAVQAAAKQLTFRFDGGAPVEVRGDPTRVRQILQNLLGNAVKYTPAGGSIGMAVERLPSGPAPAPAGWVAISVADSGPGIPPEARDHVFDEFVRIASTNGGQPGNGVGLSISRQLARLMGGEVTLNNGDPVGCTFTLWLRAA